MSKMKKKLWRISAHSLIVSLLILLTANSRAHAVFDNSVLDGRHYINIVFILDCSASMNKIIGPVRKIDIAKKNRGHDT